jgi:hypothetical protein
VVRVPAEFVLIPRSAAVRRPWHVPCDEETSGAQDAATIPTRKREIIMSARSIRKFSFVSAALLGALACGPVDPSVDPVEGGATQSAEAASARQTGVTTLEAIQDTRVQPGPSTFGHGAILWTNAEAHVSYVQFDLSELPADARIESAELKLYFNGNYPGTNSVQVGQVEGAWDEATLNWDTPPPAVTWNGPFAEVGDVEEDIAWDVTSIVRSWQNGSEENFGFGLHSLEPGGKQYWTKDAPKPDVNLPPRLVISYSIPVTPPGPLPDLGDAPDSTNHHGVANTAYPGVGVLGNFPTVYQVPAGQAAGPRHDNQTLQALLGNFITPEQDADVGPDADGRNNILRNAMGMIVDTAGQDRADEGWRNRNIRFYNCYRQTLRVRVTRPAGATQNQMFINTWFDGDRGGDWTGGGVCVPPGGGAAQPSTEWIVRNYPVNMALVPPGGFLDIDIPTERVHNPTENQPHWMRFTLSEAPAVTPPGGGLPDGRGPHPLGVKKSYTFGETEDYFQIPPAPGTLGELVLEKRVLGAANPEPQGGIVTYEIKLTNVGGSGPAPAFIRDQLPAPLHPIPLIASEIDVTSPGGAFPLQANLGLAPNPNSGAPEFVVNWDGVLDPNSSVVLRFDVHVHPTCFPLQSRKTIVNLAEAGGFGASAVAAEASFVADCPGTVTAVPADPQIDISTLPLIP